VSLNTHCEGTLPDGDPCGVNLVGSSAFRQKDGRVLCAACHKRANYLKNLLSPAVVLVGGGLFLLASIFDGNGGTGRTVVPTERGPEISADQRDHGSPEVTFGQVAQQVELGLRPPSVSNVLAGQNIPVGLYIEFANARAKEDVLSVRLFSGETQLHACADFVLQYRSGSYVCQLQDVPAGAYEFRVFMSGVMTAQYPFVIEDESETPLTSPPPAGSTAFNLPTTPIPTVWEGEYSCVRDGRRRNMHATLRMEDQGAGALDAVFEFQPQAGGGPRGAFTLTGTFDAVSRRFSLSPGNWLHRDGDWSMSSISGVIDWTQGTLDGDLEFNGCSNLNANLVR